MKEDLREELLELTRAARAYAENEKEEGRRHIEAAEDMAFRGTALHASIEATSSSVEMAAIQPTPSGVEMEDVRAKLEDIARRIAQCQRCELAQTRTRTVPGQGAVHPDIMFIGEGPGEEEDKQGLAFVGRAGQLLTRIIEAMGYKREDVFIGNIVKCRPPGNRTPYPHEMEACMPFLEEQIALLKPKVIVALGGTAVRGLVRTETGITKLRGQWMEFRGIPVMPTYHPAYLLRNEGGKKYVWADMLEVLKFLGRKPPPRRH